MKQMDNILLKQTFELDEIKNRLNCIELMSKENGTENTSENETENVVDIDKIIDVIMTQTNLSEITDEMATLQAENKELRNILSTQQNAITEINTLLLKLLSSNISSSTSNNTNQSIEIKEIETIQNMQSNENEHENENENENENEFEDDKENQEVSQQQFADTAQENISIEVNEIVSQNS
jgi:hypothetical protein